MKDIKVIPWEFQHQITSTNVDKKGFSTLLPEWTYDQKHF